MEVAMGIRIEFKDGMQGEVPETVLDRLLEMNLIAKFERKSGWAELGRDPIRQRPPVVSLPERRSDMQELSRAGLMLPKNDSIV
jgi:hypothetical protein